MGLILCFGLAQRINGEGIYELKAPFALSMEFCVWRIINA